MLALLIHGLLTLRSADNKEQNMKRKLITAILGAVLVLTSLTGCFPQRKTDAGGAGGPGLYDPQSEKTPTP